MDDPSSLPRRYFGSGTVVAVATQEEDLYGTVYRIDPYHYILVWTTGGSALFTTKQLLAIARQPTRAEKLAAGFCCRCTSPRRPHGQHCEHHAALRRTHNRARRAGLSAKQYREAQEALTLAKRKRGSW